MLTRIREGFGRSIIIVILGLIAVSFVFWGVDFNLTGPSYAAKVNGEEIPLEEFERNLQAEQSQFQELYRIELDQEVRRQLRQSVIERMVNQRALAQRVEDRGYRASDERVSDSIRSIAMFQAGGAFSLDMYRGQLAFQGLSPSMFEAMQREQIELLDLQNGVVNSSFVTPEEIQRFVELLNQRREIAFATFDVESFIARVEITSDAIAEHYEQFSSRYMTEEAAALEYVELRRSEIAEQVEVNDEELEAYYDRMRDQFESPSERRASHILITTGPDETDEEAQARADALIERIRAGEDFDTLAAEHSDDPGTASSGGDLGWIGRGMLPGPFEDTLYALEEVGAISDPVQSDFGWHIIRFDELRAGEERSFEEVRDQLAEDMRVEQADDLFFDNANQLSDLAFDEYDDLARVAEAIDLPLQRVEQFPRSGDPGVFPNSGPVVDAVFGPSALEVGINSDLLELTEEHVAVVRVVERFPPEQRPLEEVEDEIREELTRERAQVLADEAASAFAAALPETLTRDFLGMSAEADEAADGDGAAGAADDDGESGSAGEATEAQGADGAAAQGTDGGEAQGADGEAQDDPATASSGAGDSAAEDATGSADDSPAARLAAEHGGTWQGPRWVERSDPGVPTEILAAAFNSAPPAEGVHVRRPVQKADGGRALLVLSGVEPGDPAAVPLDQRTALQQQLFERTANAELGGYATSVREEANVTVPPDVLDPQY